MRHGESDSAPVDGEAGASIEEFYPGASRSIESLWELRLVALLRDLVRNGDSRQAAEALGVSERTVSRTLGSGRLTRLMRDALENHLLRGGGSAAVQQRGRVETLERRVDALEGLAGGIEDVRRLVEGLVKSLPEEQIRALGPLERRVAALEAGRSASGGPGAEAAPSPMSVEQPPVRPRRREYRELVTGEAEPGEEQVYGEATPIVAAWREARVAFRGLPDSGTALDRAAARIRLYGLEIALIEEHGLTLPPTDHPWDSFRRRSELWERRELLWDAERARRRAVLRRWLRRVLTFGLWWR